MKTMRMRAMTVLLTALAPALAVAACGGDAETREPTETATSPAAESSQAVTVTIGEQNDSGQTGTATLNGSADGSFNVMLTLEGADDGRPAHIHDVTCAEYAALKDVNAQVETVATDLSPIDAGTSETTVTAFLDWKTLRGGGYSINVHKSIPPYRVVACGDIPSE